MNIIIIFTSYITLHLSTEGNIRIVESDFIYLEIVKFISLL